MYYLNNSGHRWIADDMQFALYINGKFSKLRKADLYEAFGNFALTHFRFASKRYAGFPRDCEKHEDTYPIIDLDKARLITRA